MNKKQKKNLKKIITALILLILIRVSQIFITYEELTIGSVPAGKILIFALYMVPYFIVGWPILVKAFKGIRNKQVFDENFLMAVATVGAIAIGIVGDGDYVEAVAVMLFYQIGELFQSIAVGKSRKNITELMDIRPDYANLETAAGIEQVDPDEVSIGSVIVVKPGEKVPIDGIVIEGSSSLNTAALTGESLPRDVVVDDEIISGCINMTGLLKIRTTKGFGESTVSKILDLVENAASRKSRSENFISKFAKIYTPAVCYGALVLAILPPVISMIAGYPANWGQWVYRALTFLVISCPCALVISIPLSFFAGIGGAGNAGILVKGSNYLEALSNTVMVVFDKTGTLTEGVFEVTEIIPAGSFGKAEILEYAAYAECFSSHPISLSLKKAYGKEIDESLVTEVSEIGGHGVKASYNGHVISAGNQKLMKEQNIAFTECNRIGTLVYISVDSEFAGCIVISDVLKSNSKKAIQALNSIGIKKTVMLTGDAKNVADSIAAELGISEVHSELLPGDKVAKVEEFLDKKDKNELLAFVGDGINDAPVLSRADIGIAMGALGSDAAIEAADIVLMDDDPLKIAKAIKIAKKCMRIVYENIWFAIGVKLLCLLLGALGIANMWLAIFADVGVMVIAVLNAIRALRVRNL